MSFMQQLGQVWIMIPVVVLLAAGFMVTLQSGHPRLGQSQGVRQLAGNLSTTVALVGLCLVVLMLVQSIVGYNLRASW